MNSRRLTIINRAETSCGAPRLSPDAAARTAIIDSPALLAYILRERSAMGLDVELLILDHTHDTPELQSLLASLPADFAADVLSLVARGEGWLSSLCRDGSRILRSMSPRDIARYLDLHHMAGAIGWPPRVPAGSVLPKTNAMPPSRRTRAVAGSLMVRSR